MAYQQVLCNPTENAKLSRWRAKGRGTSLQTGQEEIQLTQGVLECDPLHVSAVHNRILGSGAGKDRLPALPAIFFDTSLLSENTRKSLKEMNDLRDFFNAPRLSKNAGVSYGAVAGAMSRSPTRLWRGRRELRLVCSADRTKMPDRL
jgi:hypothetical protein